MRKKDNTDYYIHRHSCFLLQYHIVFVTKFRHPVLVNGVRDAVYERIRYVADQRGFHILEINGEPDHVHILLEADTNFTGRTCQCFKNTNCQKSQKVVWRYQFKKYYWKPYFWSDSYFISSVSEKQSAYNKNNISKIRGKNKVCPSGLIHPCPCGAVAPMDVVLCSFYRHRHQVPVNCIFAYFLLVSYILLSQFPLILCVHCTNSIKYGRLFLHDFK